MGGGVDDGKVGRDSSGRGSGAPPPLPLPPLPDESLDLPSGAGRMLLARVPQARVEEFRGLMRAGFRGDAGRAVIEWAESHILDMRSWVGYGLVVTCTEERWDEPPGLVVRHATVGGIVPPPRETAEEILGVLFGGAEPFRRAEPWGIHLYADRAGVRSAEEVGAALGTVPFAGDLARR